MTKENCQPKPQTSKQTVLAVPKLSQLSLDELNEISAAGGGTDGTGQQIE